MSNVDPTEPVRRALTVAFNNEPRMREELEKEYGKENVWDTGELQRDVPARGAR